MSSGGLRKTVLKLINNGRTSKKKASATFLISERQIKQISNGKSKQNSIRTT
jgi:hypothetical protein